MLLGSKDIVETDGLTRLIAVPSLLMWLVIRAHLRDSLGGNVKGSLEDMFLRCQLDLDAGYEAEFERILVVQSDSLIVSQIQVITVRQFAPC